MNIGEICTQEVVMADRAMSLQQAAALMRQHHVGALVVTASSADAVQAVGMVTDRDLVIEARARGLLVSGDGGHLYGIVSLDDLLDALAHEVSEVAHAVRRGIERETAERPALASMDVRAVRIPASY